MQAAALPQVFAETFAAFVQTAAVGSGSGYAVNELHFSEQRLLTFGLCAACEQSVIIIAVTVPFTAVPSTAFSKNVYFQQAKNGRNLRSKELSAVCF